MTLGRLSCEAFGSEAMDDRWPPRTKATQRLVRRLRDLGYRARPTGGDG
jgi:hypothetical protein